MKKLFILLMAFAVYLPAEHYGLKPLTEEHKAHLRYNSPKVISVQPNKIGAHRMRKCGNKKCKAVLDQEVSVDLFGDVSEPIAATSFPRSVNNSTLASFPPIGDQQSLGSCVAWSTTYYQTSHEIGLANGYNNKSSNAHVFSPKWTYNLLNDGVDEGLIPMDAYNLLSKNGAPSISSFPYDANYLAWDLNQQHWIDALSARTSSYQLVSGAGSSPQNLTNIKQLLVNGHVLSFCTYVNSWVFTHVKADPSVSSNPHAGELACSWVNGYNGGHCITIVGYDDDVWIDVNGNGVVDSGEKGAFLVANSWGNDWGNNGFVWISYDAFLPTSAVKNGPKTSRVPAGDALDNYFSSILPKATGYTPQLVALFTLNQNYRNQIWTALGTSSVSQTSPSTTFNNSALASQGGSYGFNGRNTGSPQTGSFALDFTDLLVSSSSMGNQRYYLLLQDSKSSNPTNLTAYTLKDLVHNQTASCSGLPLVCDNKRITPFIDYNFNAAGAPDTIPPVVTITSPVNGATVSGDFFVTVNASDNKAVAQVEFYVDDVLKATDTTTPYLFDLDTTRLSEGTHTIKVIAYDTSSNQSQSSVSIIVDNVPAPAPTPPPTPTPPAGVYLSIDCGGPGDQGFTQSMIVTQNSNDLPIVYKTARAGSFSYNIPVPNGTYSVKLKFAELAPLNLNKTFNVALNGHVVLPNFSVFKAAGGLFKAYDVSFPTTVTNGKIVVKFIPGTGLGYVNGIDILR